MKILFRTVFSIQCLFSLAILYSGGANCEETPSLKAPSSKLFNITSAANAKSADNDSTSKSAAPTPESVDGSRKGKIGETAVVSVNSGRATPSKKSSARDRDIPKIAKVLYDDEAADEPIIVYGKRGYTTHIQFAVGERIEHCGGGKFDCLETGDSNGWFITGNAGDRSVFIKPKSTAFNTNLILITNLYSYTLDLRVLPDDAKSEGNWRVSFYHNDSNPSDPGWQERELKDRLSNPLRYQRNRNYTMQKIEGSDEIIPSAAWDDGRMTYVRIANNRSKPSFFKVMPDKTEQSTIFHMEGDVVVLHEVARQWVMRYGSQVIAIYNEAFDSEGIPPVNGTLIPGVARITKEPT